MTARPAITDSIVFTYTDALDGAVKMDTDDSVVCIVTVVTPLNECAQMKDYRSFVAEFGPTAVKLITSRVVHLNCTAGLAGTTQPAPIHSQSERR